MKDFQFKRIGRGNQNFNLIDEIISFKEKYPNGEISIATDSQPRKKKIKYATVVALHKINSSGCGEGAMCFYQIHFTPRTSYGKAASKDFNKLYLETDYSLKLAISLREHLEIKNINIKKIELDYNTDVNYFSNTVLIAALGYVKGMGFTPITKPNLKTMYAADNLCKGD